MSLDITGIDKNPIGQKLTIEISDNHPLIRLANKLPWEDILAIILPDLQNTQKEQYWRGRPLKIRIHLGVYLLQQMYNLTDRQAEYALKDNAAFQLFCGRGIVDRWHAPDYTKIEDFRSRLMPESQRQLANIITAHAAKLSYACPTEVDIDSTVQEANISPPSLVNLLLKLAVMAKKIANALVEIRPDLASKYNIKLGWIRGLVLNYYSEKRAKKTLDEERNKRHKENHEYLIRKIWNMVLESVVPIAKDAYQLLEVTSLGKYWGLRQTIETLTWRGMQFLDDMHAWFNHQAQRPKLYSFHAKQVQCFNKNKIGKQIQYGRHYQIARVKGNFAYVGPCVDLQMSDAQSIKLMVTEHGRIFDSAYRAEDSTSVNIKSIAFDRGYHSHQNKEFLESCHIQEIYLPKRRRYDWEIPDLDKETEVKLHNRRAGIEAIIGHIKHGGQLRRSRMKSDNTTLSAGYSAILGFNLRQLRRYATGKVRPIYQNEQKMVA